MRLYRIAGTFLASWSWVLREWHQSITCAASLLPVTPAAEAPVAAVQGSRSSQDVPGMLNWPAFFP